MIALGRGVSLKIGTPEPSSMTLEKEGFGLFWQPTLSILFSQAQVGSLPEKAMIQKVSRKGPERWVHCSDTQRDP